MVRPRWRGEAPRHIHRPRQIAAALDAAHEKAVERFGGEHGFGFLNYRRDASYSDRPLDVDIIYFGDLVLEGPGEFQLPRPELHHAYVLKPLADVAPDFVDPVRNITLGRLWAAHPQAVRTSAPALRPRRR